MVALRAVGGKPQGGLTPLCGRVFAPEMLPMSPTRVPAFVFALLLAGCASGPEMQVDENLLSGLGPGQMQGVIAARSDRDVAFDAYSKAQQDKVGGQNELMVAKTELEIAKSELDHAEAKASIAKGGTNEDFQRAQDEVAVKSAQIESRKYNVTWRQRRIELLDAKESLGKKKLEMQEARVEAAKARAVQDLDRAEVRDISVSRFDLQVTQYKSGVAGAEQEAASVAVEVEEALKALQSAKARLQALQGTPAPVAPASSGLAPGAM